MYHFMETCRPSDIRRAVHDMLDDCLSKEPERTLRQRVVATYNAYQDAQRIYNFVYPELHERLERNSRLATAPRSSQFMNNWQPSRT